MSSEVLFLDPIMGAPLAMYIDKDVRERDALVDLVTKHGGTVSNGYSGVPYILVDPYMPSGQSLYRQYAGKKGKVILDARWVRECVSAGALRTFHDNWAGCKVTGKENIPERSTAIAVSSRESSDLRRVPTASVPNAASQPQVPSSHFSYPVYPVPIASASRPTAPTQPWQAFAQNYRDSTWDRYDQTQPYREQQHPEWASTTYYDPSSYDHTYDPSTNFMDRHETNAQNTSTESSNAASDRPRGRKRIRPPSTPSSTLVVPRKHPVARSPTPPSRVIKSTYGGNLFTEEDVLYLKKYIDHCQDQGLILSLREICERIAVKAPHHTFFSWRRYCNKHQIRLPGYALHPDLNGDGEANEGIHDDQANTSTAAEQMDLQHGVIPSTDMDSPRNRSPTPPRALFRSTTGKGVAFTEEDVRFLVRFMEYRRSAGNIDMVAFWKDVAAKAPHHSRASWMKFWRRHKHELNHNAEEDEPLPLPPEKKLRYSREDDILLAKYFMNKPEGTLDKIFQNFARQHPHHPWKGWQEHHRIHKAKIDHVIQQLLAGEDVDSLEPNIAQGVAAC